MNTELSASEIAAIPIRRTWYGVVGAADSQLVPQYLTSDSQYAHAKAHTLNCECPSCGPWHVVTLTENLRVPQS